MSKHAVYITGHNRKSRTFVTLRVGQPVDLNTATMRYERLVQRYIPYADSKAPKRGKFSWLGRRYVMEYVEIRAVDDTGRGYGSPRHALAFTVSCNDVARLAA